ncbi:hypothetical protein K474DRAFT_411041 [Panus rudis PR-1116 ss-1]|nr:hypothetical protein K474DRAFT_411041 [Panus rudis PR-1116 ss-1]
MLLTSVLFIPATLVPTSGSTRSSTPAIHFCVRRLRRTFLPAILQCTGDTGALCASSCSPLDLPPSLTSIALKSSYDLECREELDVPWGVLAAQVSDSQYSPKCTHSLIPRCRLSSVTRFSSKLPLVLPTPITLASIPPLFLWFLSPCNNPPSIYGNHCPSNILGSRINHSTDECTPILYREHCRTQLLRFAVRFFG